MKNLIIILLSTLSLLSCTKDIVDKSQNNNSTNYNEKFMLDILGTLPVPNINNFMDSTIAISSETGNPVFNSELKDYTDPITTTYKRSAISQYSNITPLNGTDELWPGNIISGKDISNGILNSIPLSKWRNPGRVAMHVVSGQINPLYRDVDTLSSTRVVRAMNDIIAKYDGTTPALYTVAIKEVHGIEEMAYESDLTLDSFNQLTDNTFTKIKWNIERRYLMVKLKQTYFIMNYEPSENFFKDDFNLETLKILNKEGDVPCYIAAVHYGRIFYILYEIEDKMNYDFNKTKEIIDPEDSISKPSDIKNLESKIKSIYIFQKGGNAEDGLKTISDNYDGCINNIRDFLVKGANFSKNNVGAPICFDIRNLSNRELVNIQKNINTQYDIREYFPSKKENDITITFIDYKSKAVVRTGGNYSNTSNYSEYTIKNIRIEVSNPINNTKNTTNVKFTHSGPLISEDYAWINECVNLGKLGENTPKKISIIFDVELYVKRYGGGSSSSRKTITVTNEYSFDVESKCWKLSHSNNQDAKTNSLSSIGFSTILEYRKINQTMNIRITADRKIQK